MRSLSPSGLAAATDLGHALASIQIAAIYSSPYTRALETIGPLAGLIQLQVREASELRERTLGRFDRGSFSEAIAATWEDFDFAHPEGETNRAAQARVREFVDLLVRKHPTETVVVATHGILLALLLNSFDLKIGLEFWESLSLPDAYRLEIDRDQLLKYERATVRAG